MATAPKKKPRTVKNDRAAAKRHKLMAEALEIRLTGASYSQIAEELRVSKTEAYRLVQEAITETIREPAEELIALEQARYDDLLASFYPLALQGDPAAAKTCLEITARIERLNGITGPLEANGQEQARSLLATIAEAAHTIANTTND